MARARHFTVCYILIFRLTFTVNPINCYLKIRNAECCLHGRYKSVLTALIVHEFKWTYCH